VEGSLSAWIARLLAPRSAWDALWVEIRVMARTEPALQAYVAGEISYTDYRAACAASLHLILACDAIRNLWARELPGARA
jgi:hypothetical protein